MPVTVIHEGDDGFIIERTTEYLETDWIENLHRDYEGRVYVKGVNHECISRKENEKTPETVNSNC